MTLNQIYDALRIEHGNRVTDKGTSHSYIPIYSMVLEPLRTKPVTFLEVGVERGSSQVMWRRYFVNAEYVGGLDINYDSLIFPALRDLLQVDSTNYEKLDEVLGKLQFDVVIDDGCHDYTEQSLTLTNLLPRVKPGGFYFIEDVQTVEFAQRLSEQAQAMSSGLSCVTYDLRVNKRRGDDILVQLMVNENK